MIFEHPDCPKCGQKATHVMESVLCHTAIVFDGANANWNTEEGTEVFWDSSENVVEPESIVTLHCDRCAHSWSTKMEGFS